MPFGSFRSLWGQSCILFAPPVPSTSFAALPQTYRSTRYKDLVAASTTTALMPRSVAAPRATHRLLRSDVSCSNPPLPFTGFVNDQVSERWWRQDKGALIPRGVGSSLNRRGSH